MLLKMISTNQNAALKISMTLSEVIVIYTTVIHPGDVAQQGPAASIGRQALRKQAKTQGRRMQGCYDYSYVYYV